MSGQLREFAPHGEEIWKFSPFNYLSIYRWIRRAEPGPSFGDWQMVFLLTILGLRFLQLQADLALDAQHTPTAPIRAGWMF